MIKSMTAYGRACKMTDTKKYTVEIRAVNGKFFDCTVKAGRTYGFLEDKIKTYLQSNGILRGKIDVYINVDVVEQRGVYVALDSALAASYLDAVRRLRDEFDLLDDISTMRISQYRDIFTVTKPDEDLESEWEVVRDVTDMALAEFLTMRQCEGTRLAEDILSKLEEVRALAAEVKILSEDDIDTYAERLCDRIKTFLKDNTVDINEQRILTEAAIFADKASIDEELVRLDSHFSAFYAVFEENEPIGRKLDFLLQEINRETNTIGSKSPNTKIAHIVVNMKSVLEKIREQVQNIE